MSHSSFLHTALTGRLSEKVSGEIVLALLTVGLITGISLARLEGPLLYLLPIAAVGYSAVRIVLVARRRRRGERDRT